MDVVISNICISILVEHRKQNNLDTGTNGRVKVTRSSREISRAHTSSRPHWNRHSIVTDQQQACAYKWSIR